MKLVPGIATFALLTVFTQAQTPTTPATSTPNPVPAQTPAGSAKDGALKNAATPATPATPARHASLKYTAPKNVATGTRIDGDGGSRGGGGNQPSLYVLAPNHTALTTKAQPSLFWYQSKPAGTRFELTVIEPKKPKPLLKVGAEKADQAGIHRLLLGKYNVTLTPGVTYRWAVALVPDQANRSEDVVAWGTIERTEPDAEFVTALANAQGLDKAALYAGKGFWYDALEAVTNAIDAAPKDKALRLQRATLLDQAGLKDAAASERK
jgi:hypothetical protein